MTRPSVYLPPSQKTFRKVTLKTSILLAFSLDNLPGQNLRFRPQQFSDETPPFYWGFEARFSEGFWPPCFQRNFLHR